jgi:hypothetical protein
MGSGDVMLSVHRTALAVFIATVAHAACAPPGDPEAVVQDGTAETEVLRTLESYYTAFSARDWPLFEAHFWPGATLTTIWTPSGEDAERVVTTTVPSFVAQAPEGPDSREVFEERLVSAEITVEGGLAQAWVRYRARFGDPGDIFEWEGLDAFTLMRHGGQWKITSLAYASDG